MEKPFFRTVTPAEVSSPSSVTASAMTGAFVGTSGRSSFSSTFSAEGTSGRSCTVNYKKV